MGFYGRDRILSLADQLIDVNGGSLVPLGGKRPILIVQGCGGSGRSSLLRQVSRNWSARTPTAWVDGLSVPLDISQGHNVTSIKLVLSEMMLQFADQVPGYRVAWTRLPLVLIAMQAPVNTGDPDGGEQEMIHRLTTYQDRAKLAGLLKSFMELAPSIAATPGPVPVNVGLLAAGAAKVLVSQLERSRRQAERAWGAALTWFAPAGKEGNPGAAIAQLIRLSRIATQKADTQQQELDSRLMKAFLADLTESAAELRGHPYNFLLVLDNADSQAGQDFLTTLAETRRELFRPGAAPDPLTMIAGGGEIGALGLMQKAPRYAVGDQVANNGNAGVLRIGLEGLVNQEVKYLMEEYPWGADEIYPATHVVEHMVYRLTAGHCLATDLILRELQLTPSLAVDLNRLLGGFGENGIARRVLTAIIKGLNPLRKVTPPLVDDLVTLSAARHSDEARLLRKLLSTAEDELAQLWTETLWSHPTPDGRMAMVPVARHLLLRELAARELKSAPGWEETFGYLRDKKYLRGGEGDEAAAEGEEGNAGERAEDETDLINRLHQSLALGQVAEVAAELRGLVRRDNEAEWLTFLDAIVVTPPAHESSRGEPASVPALPADKLGRPILRLVAALRRLSDPCGCKPQDLHDLYLAISRQYLFVAEHGPEEWRLVAERAEYFRWLAGRIG
jgi:hypothetical protein